MRMCRSAGTELSDSFETLAPAQMRREMITMGKPYKAALSKAGSALASSGSSKSSQSKAGATLGKGSAPRT
ncbi:hypothetical protein CHMI_01960 [Cellulomonas hominis]|nr:hypothetical protein CHMI_01960 [Cellulomonas hominis]